MKTHRKNTNILSLLLVAMAVVLALGAFGLDSKMVSRASGETITTSVGRPLGTFTLGGATTSGCPSGFTCNIFTVSVPGISQDAKGVIADWKPTVPTRGLIIFFSGDNGTSWWGKGSTLLPSFFQSLSNSGFELVQVAWSLSWLQAPTGEPLGQQLLASRSATAIKWIHDNMYTVSSPGLGHCGFCVTGNSAGASETAYVLSSYGLDNIIDAAIPTSGPPMAGIEKGCLQVPGYQYAVSNAQLIDLSYGFSPQIGGGPCVSQDPAFTPVWVENSNETGGTNYNYPTTRVHIIVGNQDQAIIKNRANDYYDVLLAAQQQMLTLQTVPLMSHNIQQSQDGLNALFAALTE